MPSSAVPGDTGQGPPSWLRAGPSLGRGLASRGLPLPRWPGLSPPAWGSPIRWLICTGIGRRPVTGGGRCLIGGAPCPRPAAFVVSECRPSLTFPSSPPPVPSFSGPQRGRDRGPPEQSGDIPGKASLAWALKDRHSWERHPALGSSGLLSWGTSPPLWSRDPPSGPLCLQPGSGRRRVSSVRPSETRRCGRACERGGAGGKRGPRRAQRWPWHRLHAGPSLEPGEAVSGRPRRPRALSMAVVLPQRLSGGRTDPGVGRQLCSSAAERA